MNFFIFCGSILMIEWLCTLMNNEYWYPASSKSGSNTIALITHAMLVGSCHVYDCNQHIWNIFIPNDPLSRGSCGYQSISAHLLERHLGLDFDDIVARQHSNWRRSRCWYLKIKFVILLLHYCLHTFPASSPGRFSRALRGGAFPTPPPKTGKSALGARLIHFLILSTENRWSFLTDASRLICHLMLETILIKNRN